MNKALFLSTIEQWWVSPQYMGLWTFYFLCLLFASSGGLIFLDYVPQETYLFHPLYMLPFVLMLGSGIVAEDIASGVLSITLARPIRRSGYIITKWLALSGMCSFISLLLLVLEQTAATVTFPYLLPNQEFFINAVGRISVCFGVSATMVALSSMAPKRGQDFAAWIVMMWLAFVFRAISTITIYGNSIEEKIIASLQPAWYATSQTLFQFALTRIDLESITRNDGVSWFSLSAYFCTIAISLLIASIQMNRTEVTYAAQ